MGKWTRRAFITTGVLTGGALVVGIAIRPGNRAGKVSELDSPIMVPMMFVLGTPAWKK